MLEVYVFSADVCGQLAVMTPVIVVPALSDVEKLPMPEDFRNRRKLMCMGFAL